ncbi:outer membrane beta-barrel protein [bacterium]|nr:outer membrane beta-barrel protein [bacterium]
MKRSLAVILLLLLVTGSVLAQEKKTEKQETNIRIEQTKEEKSNYYTVRFGAWFPKDEEKAFNYNNNLIEETGDFADQSQALGLDFHFRRNVGRPLFFDASASVWYTTTDFNFSNVTSNPDEIQDASTWSIILPITVGLSVAPLPDNPIQPYAMAGVGAYFGFTGRDITRVSNQNEPDDTETYIRFGFYLGAGLDFLFAEDFGISAGAKYQFIKFDDPLFTGQTDLTGLQATIGFVMRVR